MSKKKDPAFLFYPKDWIQGTAKLMPEEKGVYIDLLAHQHQDKDLPNDTKRLSRIVGLSEKEFIKIWDILRHKFVEINGNRLVNRKLTEVMTERSTTSQKNTIIGTLASVVRLSDVEPRLKDQIKKEFDYNFFMGIDRDLLTNAVTEWFTQRLGVRLKSIANGNADNIDNTNKLWFLRFFHSDYETYKNVFNGQSASNDMFLEWKEFIDFIYAKNYIEIFECKFLSPHDYAKLVSDNNFTKNQWESVIKSILSTGVKPEHNLFFRIPQFMKYSEKETKKITEKSDYQLENEKKINNFKGMKEQ